MVPRFMLIMCLLGFLTVGTKLENATFLIFPCVFAAYWGSFIATASSATRRTLFITLSPTITLGPLLMGNSVFAVFSGIGLERSYYYAVAWATALQLLAGIEGYDWQLKRQ